MAVRIGIPRALAYFAYGDIWTKYFNALGCEVTVSPPTNKAIVNEGTKETVGEACIPVKIFHGHVMWLRDKVDYIFIPRFLNIREDKDITYCPKFLGLPDLIKASVPNLPAILSPNIVLNGKKNRLLKFAAETAKKIGKSPLRGIYAISKLLLTSNARSFSKSGVTFAVVGYPYFLHDEFLNFNIQHKIEKNGITVINSDSIDEKLTFKYRNKLSKSLFWEFSNSTLLATYYLLHELKVDGIIHLSAFACGPDTVVGKLIELECKALEVPFLQLTFDEHTGEAGLLTRIEAFIDMFNLRRISI